VANSLSRALNDAGLELTPATRRLNQFNAVQNTYLGTFQILGGLGLILGSVGLGIVVLRNVFERRGELALLLAVGYRARALKKLVLLEHSALLVAGLSLGILAAFIAVLPNLLSPAAEVPYASLGLTLCFPRPHAPRRPPQRRPLDLGRHIPRPPRPTPPRPAERMTLGSAAGRIPGCSA
jgi:putative ABC transport system permease protein